MVILTFLLLLLVGVPVAFVLAATSLTYILTSENYDLLSSYPEQLFGGLESYGLLALPLFILVGETMNEGGIARRLLNMASALLGSVRGGLAYINLASNMMMASILGSSVAQITIMSKMAVPEMEKAGYPRDMSVAITAAGSLLAPVVPPSMLFVIFGVIAQISIGNLFIAGIIPGLLLGLAFLALLGWMSHRHQFPRNAAITWRERGMALLLGAPSALVPITIVGSILTGLATPTEAAALSCLASIVVGKFIYRELEWKTLWPALVRTARSSAIVLLLIAAAEVFGWVITYENIPSLTADWIQTVAQSPTAFLFMVVGLLLLLGIIIDPIPAIILVVPVLLPVATNVYGVDVFHFGVLVCLTLVLGLLTPPVGTALFTASAMSGVKAERIAWLLIPFFLAMLAVLALLVLVPSLITLLL